jgi:hypothetical protein
MYGLAASLAMTVSDIATMLHALEILAYHKGVHKLIVPTALVERHKAQKEKEKVKPKRLIDPARITVVTRGIQALQFITCARQSTQIHHLATFKSITVLEAGSDVRVASSQYCY